MLRPPSFFWRQQQGTTAGPDEVPPRPPRRRARFDSGTTAHSVARPLCRPPGALGGGALRYAHFRIRTPSGIRLRPLPTRRRTTNPWRSGASVRASGEADPPPPIPRTRTTRSRMPPPRRLDEPPPAGLAVSRPARTAACLRRSSPRAREAERSSSRTRPMTTTHPEPMLAPARGTATPTLAPARARDPPRAGRRPPPRAPPVAPAAPPPPLRPASPPAPSP